MVVVVDFCGDFFFQNPWWGFWWHGMDDHVHFIPCNSAMTHRLCFFQKFLIYRLTRPMILLTTFQPKSVGVCLAKKYATMTTGNMATLRGSWVFTRKALWNRVFGDLAHWQVEPKRFVGLLLYNPFFGIYLEILQEPKQHIKICVCSPQVEGLSFGINNHDTIISGVDLVNVVFIFWIGFEYSNGFMEYLSVGILWDVDTS